MDRMLNRLVQAATDPAPATDSELLDGFLTSHSEPAFESLVRRHGPMVLAVCRRVLRHREDAEDAFQATFLILARRAADVWPRDAVGSWLYGVAHRVALKARTVRARRLTREQPLDENPPATSTELPPPDLAEVIDRAVRKLPEVYRVAVVACDLEGLTRKAAAEQLGWKEGTLSGRLARARQLLASRLRKAGLVLPAGGVGAALGTADGLSADLVANTVRTAVGSSGGKLAAGVSAPVAALTEGVVRGMFLTKIKAVAVVLLAAGALGFGVWASAGAGDGPGNAAQPGAKTAGAKDASTNEEPQPQGEAAPGPRIELAVQELDVLGQEIDLLAAKGKVTPDDLDRLKARTEAVRGLLAPGKELLQTPSNAPGMAEELKRMQGKWQITSRMSGNFARKMNPDTEDPRELVIEVRGNKMRFPYLDEGQLKFSEVTIWRLDASKSPNEIDLIAPNGIVDRGIYRIKTEPGRTTLVLSFGRHSRPSAFGAPGDGGAEITLVRVEDDKKPEPNPTASDPLKDAKARREIERALAQENLAQAKAVVDVAAANLEQAKAQERVAAAQLDVAQRRLEMARARLAQAEKAAEDIGVPRAQYTIRVRPLVGAEQVTTRQLTGNVTVQDALSTAPGVTGAVAGVEVWVVRNVKGKPQFLLVDLAAIRRGQTQSNYQLLDGDTLVVQYRPEL